MAEASSKSSTGGSAGSEGPDDFTGLPPVERITGRNGTKADILIYVSKGRKIAVKDYSPRSWLVRNTLGRWFSAREAAAYLAAGGDPALPRCLGLSGPYSLVTEWVEGKPLAEINDDRLGPAVFDRLLEIVRRLHARGLALADMHHRDVLVSDNGTVHLVDLATAWVLGDRPSRIRTYLFNRFVDQDLVSLARMRARYLGTDLAAELESVGAPATVWNRRGRRLRRLWDKLRRRR